ncbi:MAG: TlpA disulfide reductase family protein [Polyangiales bacterium]
MIRRCLPKRGLCMISILCALASGCAHDSGNVGQTTPRTGVGPRLDLGVRLTDGRWLELGDLRGSPVLVYVFATFDAVSQADLKSLRPFVPQHPDVIVVGVAAQPRATQLVEAWAYALDPPFVVGYNPTGIVETGESMLGKIETVPTFILYDANGYEVCRETGLLTEGELVAMVERLTEARRGSAFSKGHSVKR